LILLVMENVNLIKDSMVKFFRAKLNQFKRELDRMREMLQNS